MAKLLKHLCSSCGGALIIDVDAQLYRCPYCGVTYDYEYFREEDVLSKGMRALKEGEFVSAMEAFDFILTKDPHDFLALRGKLLAKGKFMSIRELNNPSTWREVTVEDVKPEEEAEAAAPGDKEYFDRIVNIFKFGEEFREADKKVTDAYTDKKRLERHFSAVANQREDNGVPVRYFEDTIRIAPWKALVVELIVFLIALGITMALYSHAGVMNIALLVTLIVMGVALVITGYKVIEDTSLKSELAGTDDRIDDKDEQIKELTAKRDAILKNIRKEYVELKKIDPELKAPAQKK